MSFNEFLLEVAEAYNKDALVYIYRNHLSRALEHVEDLPAHFPGVAQRYESIESSSKVASKAVYTYLWAKFMDEPSLFELFRKTLLPEADKCLKHLVWRGDQSATTLEQELGIVLTKVSKEYWREVRTLLPPFQFLQFKNARYPSYSYNDQSDVLLQLLPPIRERLRDYYEKPIDYELRALKVLPPTAHVFEGEASIFTEFPLIALYIGQQNLKTTQTGHPQKSSINKMRRTLKLQEFFPDASKDKYLRNVRTELLAEHLLAVKLRLNEFQQDHLQGIRELFQAFKSGRFPYTYALLGHLKGRGRVSKSFYQAMEQNILDGLAKFPDGQWVSASAFKNWLQYHNKLPALISKHELNYLYTEVYEADYTFPLERRIYPGNVHTYVETPIVYGLLYLLGSWGMLDLAYNEPDTREVGKTFVHVYEGLEAVRLTALGSYLLGRSSDYTPPASETAPSFTLSDQQLLIWLHNGPPELLDSYASHLGQDRYLVTHNSFLKGCQTRTDIQTKINLFKQTISSDPPANWQHFFTELLERVDSLQELTDAYRIFQLPTDDSTLIQLIATDPQLQNLMIKAEGYRVLVDRNDWAKFRNRLRALGYLL